MQRFLDSGESPPEAADHGLLVSILLRSMNDLLQNRLLVLGNQDERLTLVCDFSGRV